MYNNELVTAFNEYKSGKIELLEFLKRLPDEKERIFEVFLVKVILETEAVEAKLTVILEDNQINKEVRYSAFYCLCTYYRRRKDTSKYGDLLERYKYSFSTNPTYSYLKSMFLMQHGKEADIKEAIILARKAIREVPNNVGINHCYGEIIAEAFEEGVLNIERHKTELDNALLLLQDIINETSEYAKFYCTYGRLLAVDGRYKEAKEEILIAIDKEDSNRSDYPLRIGEYQRYLIQTTSKSYSDKAFAEFQNYIGKMEGWNSEVRESMAKSEKDIQESMMKSERKIQSNIQGSLNRNLEFLGFFAALVSFIIASVQLLTKASFQEAFVLILELGGVLIIVLSGFGIILNGNKYIKRNIVAFLMGIICISIAFCIHKLGII